MPHDVASSLLIAIPNIDVCAAGGSVVVASFSKLMDIAKYLFGVSIFLAAAIWLVNEFFRDGDRGSSKATAFILHYQLPLLLLFLAVGLLFGFAPSLFGNSLARPC